MSDEIEYGEHGDGCEPSTLTVNRLIALCLVGVACWVGIILGVVKLMELIS